MTKKEKDIRLEILELQQQIQIWNNAYFDNDDPLVSDAEYDVALVKLKELETQFAYLLTEQELKNSPTNRIGASVSNAFAKFQHAKPMLSLQKAYEKDELKRWIENVEKANSQSTFFIEPKIDGLSISLHYENGKLIRAVTRGDGTVGEDVTHNLLVNEEIPLQIDYLQPLEVRGEVYLKLSQFEQINKQLAQENKKLLVNPRNGASGTLRQLDSQITKQRKLSVYCYAINDATKHNLYTIDEVRDFLHTHNFPVTKEGKKVYNLEEILTWINEFKEVKKTLDYETDGVVIKVNEFNVYDLLGQTQKFPRWAIAFKYEPDVATTVILDIFTTVGRTGFITYNAKLEPVFLSGSTISAATLHNYDYINKLKIDIGDLVYIKKAGEIIPKVIGTVKQKGSTSYKKQKYCPKCGSLLDDSETLIDQFCTNDMCPEVRLRKLIHFASKGAMNIDFLGEKTVEMLFNKNLVTDYYDFYSLKDHYDELIQIEGYGKKSVDQILASIEKSCQNSLARLLHGISIKHIGEKNAYFIASEVQKFSNFLTFDFDKLINFDEIGQKTVDSLKNFVANEKNVAMVNNLLACGLDLEHQKNIKSLELANLVFVITGTLSQSRKETEKMLISRGAKVTNTVTKSTSYLVVGENPGSKYEKAQQLGTKIISEQDLINEFLN
ncbi:NAD-dependent DNA ligase LigA [Mycoplasma sp. 1573]